MNIHITKYSLSFILMFFVMFCAMPHHVAAQSSKSARPMIEHTEDVSGTAGETQEFIAAVSNREILESVKFYYHMASADSPEFQPVEMQRTTDKLYSVTISTKEAQPDTIHYYIEATFSDGKSITRGFLFSPLKRQLVLPVLKQTEPLPQASTTVEGSDPIVVKKSRTWMYVLGGVLVAGVVAGLSGSSDDGGSDTSCCTVQVNFPAPE